MNQQKLEQAVGFAVAHETAWTRETGDGWGIHHQDPPPWNRLLGPVHARGPLSGTIVLDGKPLISWGEPQRADLTFSIAKTYLALLAEARRLDPAAFDWRRSVYEFERDRLAIDLLLGRSDLRPMIDAGASVDDMRATWQADLAAFVKLRQRFLLYE